MPGLIVTIPGADKLAADLRSLPGKLARGAIRQAVREAAAPILAAAKSLAPVASGKLRRKLKIRVSRFNKGGYVGMTVTSSGGASLYKAKRGGVWYGGFVEYGHRVGRRGRHKLASRERKALMSGAARVPEHPFLRPAYDRNEEKAVEIMAERIGPAIETAMMG